VDVDKTNASALSTVALQGFTTRGVMQHFTNAHSKQHLCVQLYSRIVRPPVANGLGHTLHAVVGKASVVLARETPRVSASFEAIPRQSLGQGVRAAPVKLCGDARVAFQDVEQLAAHIHGGDATSPANEGAWFLRKRRQRGDATSRFAQSHAAYPRVTSACICRKCLECIRAPFAARSSASWALCFCLSSVVSRCTAAVLARWSCVAALRMLDLSPAHLVVGSRVAGLLNSHYPYIHIPGNTATLSQQTVYAGLVYLVLAIVSIIFWVRGAQRTGQLSRSSGQFQQVR